MQFNLTRARIAARSLRGVMAVAALVCFCDAPARAQIAPPIAPSSATVAAMVPHEFVFVADSHLDSVTVAGTFNSWNKDATPLRADADGLTWRATVPLPYGKQLYKFVLNGDNWTPDPRASGSETDADGNVNSQLITLPPDYQMPASPDDGQTAISALSHRVASPDLNWDRGALSLQLRARRGDLKAVRLRVGARTYPMALARQDELYAFYRAAVPWNGQQSLNYVFELQDGAQSREFGAGGLAAKARPFVVSGANFAPFVVPSWVEKTVFYQIFPDRFENGDRANDPPDVQNWNAEPTGFNRFGGDIAGVERHLDYLENLGIGGVYFNPVFAAPSNHRYDASDFRRIDPQFGTNAQFAALTRDLRKRGIATVMDFVFNHTSPTFAPFADIVKNGAQSPYKDWYFIKSYPVRAQDPPPYVAWNNYPSMPKLNLGNAATRDYMLDTVSFWKREVPLAGLRLDVADEVDMNFWRQLRARVKSLDPQMWIVGERWGDAWPWLQGDQWDGAMNYPFLFANADFFAHNKGTATEFTDRLMRLYAAYPPQVSRAMLNLLSSHDRPRFLSVCRGDARLLRLAATVQFTWPGAPSIYYGEELGMEGGSDPQNRRPMRWDLATPANPTLQFYRRLIALRNGSRALQSGDPQILMTDNGAQTLAYARLLPGDAALVAINRSEREQFLKIPLSPALSTLAAHGWSDVLSDRKYTAQGATLTLKLPPLSAAVLRPANG